MRKSQIHAAHKHPEKLSARNVLKSEVIGSERHVKVLHIWRWSGTCRTAVTT